MANFYDSQLDYFKGVAIHLLRPFSVFSSEEAFLYLPQRKTFHFRRGEEFPEKPNFAQELQESYRRRKAIGTIFYLKTRIRAPWPIIDPEGVDDNVRDAVLIMLIHPEACRLIAAADIKEVAPHNPVEVRDREGNLIPERTWIPKGPRMSGWVEVPPLSVPAEYRNLNLIWGISL